MLKGLAFIMGFWNNNKRKNLMSTLVSSKSLDAAFSHVSHVSHTKRDAHYNHGIWHVRINWPSLKEHMRKELLADDYTLSPAQVVSMPDDRYLSFSAPDTILLKALSTLLEETVYPQLKALKRCYHLKGRGQKSAIRWANKQASTHSHVYRTDIKKYYASMDKHKLQAMLSRWIDDPRILKLVWQYCDQVEEYRGVCFTPKKGIPRGGALSVVLGTLYLVDIDNAFSKRRNLEYCRYMDDLLIFCKSRYGLRQVVKEVYKLLEPLGLTLATSKTYIGKVSNGVDFLGYRIGDARAACVTISKPSVQRFCGRLHQLYEQRVPLARVKAYLTCWHRWVRGGLDQLRVTLPRSIHILINNPGNLTRFLAVHRNC